MHNVRTMLCLVSTTMHLILQWGII